MMPFDVERAGEAVCVDRDVAVRLVVCAPDELQLCGRDGSDRAAHRSGSRSLAWSRRDRHGSAAGVSLWWSGLPSAWSFA